MHSPSKANQCANQHLRPPQTLPQGTSLSTPGLTWVLQPVDHLLPEALCLMYGHSVSLHDDRDDGNVLGQLSHVPGHDTRHVQHMSMAHRKHGAVPAQWPNTQFIAGRVRGTYLPHLATASTTNSPDIVLPEPVWWQAVQAHIHAGVLNINKVNTPDRQEEGQHSTAQHKPGKKGNTKRGQVSVQAHAQTADGCAWDVRSGSTGTQERLGWVARAHNTSLLPPHLSLAFSISSHFLFCESMCSMISSMCLLMS